MDILQVDKCWVCPGCLGKPNRWDAQNVVNGELVVGHRVCENEMEGDSTTNHRPYRGKFCIRRTRVCKHCGGGKNTVELELADLKELTGANALRELRFKIDGLLKEIEG